MLSLVVYGRNDQHGYNSHRRVALSLNALAEVLTAPTDEILFVDYNTPVGMPTLPEAISDTLTDRALEVIRVLRVTAAVHEEAVGDRSKHPISEPLARNTAIRRARPGNWILSTNTDMVFVPRVGTSLSDVVAQLDPGAYCLPRFEIPEWLWEGVPRADPRQMISLLAEWGDRAGLAEVTLAHEWIRYDAPGDFQLLSRDLMESVHGFDERMIHGWHVDSNLWRRVHNKLGRIGTAYPAVAGYHANHNRTLTRWVGAQSSGNDLTKFVYDVDGWEVPSQASSWGLAGMDVPEISLRARDLSVNLAAASVRLAGQDRTLITSDTRDQRHVLEYDGRHVLPFLLDPIIAGSPRPTVGYVGINASMRAMMARSLRALSPPSALLDDAAAAARADLIVMDLGLDISTGPGRMTAADASSLVGLLNESMAELVRREHAPEVLLINGMSGIWSDWTDGHFRIRYGTYHTRVQSAEVREGLTPTPTSALGLVFTTRTPEPVPLQPGAGGSRELDLSTPEGIVSLHAGWGGVDQDGAFIDSSPADFEFLTGADSADLQHAIVDVTVWTPSGEAGDASALIRFEVDSKALLTAEMATRDRQNSFHLEPLKIEPGVHRGTLVVETPDEYDPFGRGGTQPWVRLERLRLISGARTSEWASTAEPGALMPMGRGEPGEALLRRWWAQSDSDGVWALRDGGEIVIPPSLATGELKLQLLGHPDRAGQETVVTARGDGEHVTTLSGIVADQPRIVTAVLPAPGPDGVVHLSFGPVDAPAPTGELLKIQGLGAAALSYRLGERVEFRRGSQDLIGLRNGWHAAEDAGVWMSDSRAELSLVAGDPVREGSKLLLEGACLDPRVQNLQISVNGTEARTRRRRGARLVVTVPEGIEEGELITLGFAVDPLMSPAERGMSDDPRPLGALIAALCVTN